MKNRVILIVILFGLALFLAFAFLLGKSFFIKKLEKPRELTTVTIQPVWVPNAQFAGIYVAQEKGFYKEEGLNVIVNPYDPNVSVKDYVAEGKATFGWDGADQVIIGRAEGKPLKAVAVIYRLNPVAFAAHADLNVKSPSDLKGKRIGYLPDNTSLIMKTLLSLHGLSERDIIWVPYEYNLELFYNRKIDVVPIYITDEVKKFQDDNIPFTLLLPQDYGVTLYGDTIFTREDLIETNPDLVRRFVRATLRGWYYALQNFDEAVEITKKFDDPDYELREDFILTQSFPLIHTGDIKIGLMEEEVWRKMVEFLLTQEVIKKSLEVRELFTNEFIE